jgi:SAM-dependent methyltransferase
MKAQQSLIELYEDDPINPLFDTTDMALTEMWDEVQKLQIELSLAQELAFYYSCAQWQASRTVVDLGSGNGFYLSKIAEHFPDKRYKGIDKSSELINIAMNEHKDSGIRFESCDLFEAEGLYDFIIMRLLLQHLPNIDQVLEKVAGLTRPGGSALIIDALDPLRFYYPPVPHFLGFFKAYKAHKAKDGLNRDIAGQLHRGIKRYTGWKVGQSLDLIVPSTLPGAMNLFRQIYVLFIDIVERAGELDYDFKTIRREWQWWCELDEAFTQVGVKIIRLDRI